MKFSIIVPVYNGEKYLDRCISGITSQTYTDWELIMIDDGSSDASLSIIEKYRNEDPRIRGYHQENAGPGAARNAAIEKVTGDYIVFIDVDDYIENDYLELLAPKAAKHDIVFIDVSQVDLEGNVIKDEKMSAYKSLEKDKVLKGMMTGMIPWGGVRKTVSSRIVKEHGIRYSDLKIGEEALFSFCVLYYAESVGFLDEKPVYKYELHAESQSNIRMDDPWGGTYEALRNYLTENSLYDRFAGALNAFNLSSTVVSIDRLAQNYSGAELRKKAKERIKLYKSRIDKDHRIELDIVTYKAKIFMPFLKLGMAFPIIFASRLRSKK